MHNVIFPKTGGSQKGGLFGGPGRGPLGAGGAGGGPVRPQGGDFNNLVNWWTPRGNLP